MLSQFFSRLCLCLTSSSHPPSSLHHFPPQPPLQISPKLVLSISNDLCSSISTCTLPLLISTLHSHPSHLSFSSLLYFLSSSFKFDFMWFLCFNSHLPLSPLWHKRTLFRCFPIMADIFHETMHAEWEKRNLLDRTIRELWTSLRGKRAAWAYNDVVGLATELYTAIPPECKTLLQNDTWKGGSIVTLKSGSDWAVEIKDLVVNEVFLKPCLMKFPSANPSPFYYADVWMMVDDMCGGRLLQATAEKSKASLALAEGGKLKKVTGYIRYLNRGPGKNRSRHPVVEEMKKLLSNVDFLDLGIPGQALSSYFFCSLSIVLFPPLKRSPTSTSRSPRHSLTPSVFPTPPFTTENHLFLLPAPHLPRHSSQYTFRPPIIILFL